MAFGGTRFTHPDRPRAAPRVIDVEVRSPHKTLYEVLAVPPRTSSREIRRIARALRRKLPETSALHDVCLAEQVLGRTDLRAEYDAVLARLRTAKQPLPQIGAAIEGSRLGPSFAARVGSASRASASAAGRVVKAILQVALAIAVIMIIAAGLGMLGGKDRSDRHEAPEHRPIEPVEIPLPKIEPPRLDRDTIELPKHAPPRHTAPAPRKIDPPTSANP